MYSHGEFFKIKDEQKTHLSETHYFPSELQLINVKSNDIWGFLSAAPSSSYTKLMQLLYSVCAVLLWIGCVKSMKAQPSVTSTQLLSAHKSCAVPKIHIEGFFLVQETYLIKKKQQLSVEKLFSTQSSRVWVCVTGRITSCCLLYSKK